VSLPLGSAAPSENLCPSTDDLAEHEEDTLFAAVDAYAVELDSSCTDNMLIDEATLPSTTDDTLRGNAIHIINRQPN